MERKNKYLLILILVLAGSLRFYGLNYQSLWNDELATLSMCNYNNVYDVVKYGVETDVHPPLYYLIIHFVIKFFGDGETALRIFSAISGVFAVFALYLLGKRLYTEKIGILAAALTAVLWKPIAYSQDARVYSFLFLMSALSLYFWYGIFVSFKNKDRIKNTDLIFYLISCIILEYSHYFGMFAVLLQGLTLILFNIKNKNNILKIFGIYIIIAVAFLPWLPVLIEHLAIKSIWITAPKLKYFPGMFYDFFNSSINLSIFAGIIIIFYLYKNRQELKKLSSPTILLILWLVVPFWLAYFKSMISTPVLTLRNMIIVAPAAYILFSHSILLIFEKKAYKNILAIAVFIIFSIHLIFGMGYYTTPQNEQFREASNYIIKHYNEYQNSAIIDCAWESKYFDYYFEKGGLAAHCELNICDSTDLPILATFIDTSKADYLWFVRGHRVPSPVLMDYFNSKCVQWNEKNFIGADVWLFRRK